MSSVILCARRFGASLALAACLFHIASAAAAAPILGYKVVAEYPHSTDSYTEGFLYLDGLFYEGTGIAGRSALLAIEPETGKPVQKLALAPQYFGEGIVDWGPNIYQWTWQSHICFVYDRFSFRLLRTFHYEGEGWGLTHDQTQLIMSDGTSYLRFLDPKSFKETRRVRVLDESGHPVEQLNELEYLHGEIYANIWQTDEIVRISPRTGKVLGRIDLSGIIDKRELESAGAVLNGIAYDSKGDRLFFTGKLWPKLFEIRVVEHKGAD